MKLRLVCERFLRLFFPRLCFLCKQPLVEGEEHLCLDCLFHLPYTLYRNPQENPVFFILYGAQSVTYATALLYFRKGNKVQTLLHAMKYNGYRELAYAMGRMAAYRLQHSGNPICGATLLVPVPLHRRRLRQRGYNQSEWIARGMSAVLGVPVCADALVCTTMQTSQAKLGKVDRLHNRQGVYTVAKPEPLQGQHVLLVDDVITTGVTLKACLSALSTVPNLRVSVFALSLTHEI